MTKRETFNQTWNEQVWCEDCPFRVVFKEERPWGSTTTTETLTECVAKPKDCPAVHEAERRKP